MNFELRTCDKSNYGFTIKSINGIVYEKTEAKIHLDTKYLSIFVSTNERVLCYLFDENKKYISWKQREKELRTIKERVTSYGEYYRVKRTREVKSVDSLEDGREYVKDKLYFKSKLILTKQEIELFPIRKLYDEYIESQNEDTKRNLYIKEQKKLYLREHTTKEKRVTIMSEDMQSIMFKLVFHAYHRGTEDIDVFANYNCYFKNSYLNKVNNKEEMYIEFLRKYFEILEDGLFGGEYTNEYKNKFIKEMCEKYNMIDSFNKYYKKL